MDKRNDGQWDDWSDKKSKLGGSCLSEQEHIHENCAKPNIPSTCTDTKDFIKCNEYQFCELNLNDFATDEHPPLDVSTKLQRQTSSASLQSNGGPSLKLPQTNIARWGHINIDIEIATDSVDAPRHLERPSPVTPSLWCETKLKAKCRGEMEFGTEQFLYESSLEVKSSTDTLNLIELSPHYAQQGLIKDYRHTARVPVAASYLNSGSLKSMTENEEVENVNSFSKSNVYNTSIRTDLEVLSPRSIAKYMYIRRKNDNKRMFKTKGIPKRFRPSRPYLRLCHVTAAMDIRLSFKSVLRNTNENLPAKLDDTRHIDTQVENDPDTILNQTSFIAKEDKVKCVVPVSSKELSIARRKKKYRTRRRRKKCRQKPLLGNTNKYRHDINSDDTTCAGDSDHEPGTETEVKQPITEYGCYTSESKNMLILPVPKLVENLETVLLGEHIYNRLKLSSQDFSGELKDMKDIKDIKYPQKMEELKDNNSNGMQSVFENVDILDTDFSSVIQISHAVIPTSSHNTYAIYPVLGSGFGREEYGTQIRAHEEIRNNWNRLYTFRRYTGNGSAINLARGGFACEYEGNQVRCRLCPASYSNWQYPDNVEEIHRRLSPNCPFLAPVNGPTNSPVVQTETNAVNHIAPDVQNRIYRDINRCLLPNPFLPIPDAQSYARRPNILRENGTMRVTTDENAIANEEIQRNSSVEQHVLGAVGNSIWLDRRLTPAGQTSPESVFISLPERWTGQWATEAVHHQSSASCETVYRLRDQIRHAASDSRTNPGISSRDAQFTTLPQNSVQVSDSSSHQLSVCQPSCSNRVCRCSFGQSEIVTSRPSYHQRNGQVCHAVREEFTLSLTGLHGQTVPDNNQVVSRPYNQVGAVGRHERRTLSDERTLVDENRELRRMLFCKRCQRNESNVLFLPCRHICLCENCAKIIHRCSVCKSRIKDKDGGRIFRFHSVSTKQRQLRQQEIVGL